MKEGYADVCYDAGITTANYLRDRLVELGYTVRIGSDNQEVTVYITGMKCNSCVNKITSSLLTKNGVHSVNVSI